MSDTWPTVEDIRARTSQNVTDICANPKEYYRMQSILRDRAGMLHHYDEAMKLLRACIESMAGYRREMNDHQPCDAEKAARAVLGETDAR
jgi:hypothetical protein